MNENVVTVTSVLDRWCSCGCCAPYGEGMGVMPESYPDMARVALSNGEVVTTPTVEVGTEMYYHEEGDWYPFPEE